MNASVIIPTYNGANKILNILEALENQNDHDFEVIIVVDGSSDNTIDLLKKRDFNFQSFKILVQSNQGRSITRNNGAKEATGGLLIFFDDDMFPSENCVEKHLEHHKKYPDSILIGAQIDKDDNSRTEIQFYKAYLSKRWIKTIKGLYSKPLSKANIFLTAANFSIPKKLFNEMRGFDETLTDAEDYDLAVRAFQKNIPLYYNYDAFAWHDDPITCASYIKRQREYRIMHDKLFTLNPDLYRSFPIGELKLPTGIKALIFKMFAFKFWIWTVDDFNWLRILPRKLRYKIYDLIITSNGVFYPNSVKLL